MRAGIVPALIVASLLAPPPSGAELPAVATTELPDHLGGSDSVAAHRGRVAVAMVVTARRLRNLKGWQRELQERFEQVDFILIADVPTDPPVTFEQVAKKLGQRVPEEVPVLIDLERRWATELGLDTERPNLLLFDREGQLASSFRGRREEALLEEVSRALADLVGR